jgi:hypothetical protein
MLPNRFLECSTARGQQHGKCRPPLSKILKLKGLLQVIVDPSLLGVVVKPITDQSGDRHFCEVFFDNVELTDMDKNSNHTSRSVE